MSVDGLLRWRNRVASVDGPPSWVRRLVLMCVWFGQEWARYYGGEPAASVRDLAQWTGLHPRTIRRHLCIAESEGWVRRLDSHDVARWEPVLGEGAVT